MRSAIVLLWAALIVFATLPISSTAAVTVIPTETLRTGSLPPGGDLGYQTVRRPVQLPVTAVPRIPQVPSGEVEFPVIHVPVNPPVTIPPSLVRETGTVPENPATFPPVTITTIRTPVRETTVPVTTARTTLTVTETRTPVPTGTVTPGPTSTPSPTTSPPSPTPSPVATTDFSSSDTDFPSGRVYYPPYFYPYGYVPEGLVSVTSDPSGAFVSIDGDNTEVTPFTYTNVVPGYHTIEVNYPDYEAYVTNIYVDPAVPSYVDALLSPLSDYGSVFIDSTPEGAGAYVDGNFAGYTPLPVGGLTPGSHQVELHLSGYDVLATIATVNPGQATPVNLVLVPYSSASSDGSIDITTGTAGASVYLDGTYKGTTLPGNTFDLIAVSPGSHTVLLHASGYDDFVETVTVNPGQITPVSATLGPSGQAAGTGTIVLESSPAGGQVYLDNTFRGVTPITVPDVIPGSHAIVIRLPGYADWSTTVQAQAGQNVQLLATFTPGAGAATPSRTGLPAAIAVISAMAAGIIVAAAKRK